MRNKEEIKSKPLKELAKWLYKNHIKDLCFCKDGEIRETNGK